MTLSLYGVASVMLHLFITSLLNTTMHTYPIVLFKCNLLHYSYQTRKIAKFHCCWNKMPYLGRNVYEYLIRKLQSECEQTLVLA